jgi:hypothetical protein
MALSRSLNKPGGYVIRDGKEVGAFHTCAHCSDTWKYVPGSGNTRGYCMHCDRLVCGKPACMAGCAPINAILGGGDTAYEMNEHGVMVRKG